jgi:hypothetical protein
MEMLFTFLFGSVGLIVWACVVQAELTNEREPQIESHSAARLGRALGVTAKRWIEKL